MLASFSDHSGQVEALDDVLGRVYIELKGLGVPFFEVFRVFTGDERVINVRSGGE